MHYGHTDVLLLLTHCTPTHALPDQYSSELPAFDFAVHDRDTVQLLIQMSRLCTSTSTRLATSATC